MKKVLFSANVYRHLTAFHMPYMKLLMENGYEVSAIANEDYGGHKEKLEAIGVRTIDVPLSRNPLSPANLQTYKILKQLFKEEQFDMVHVHTPVAAFLTRLAFKDANYGRIIYTAHGFHFFKDAPLKNWLLYFPLEKFNVKNTDLLITTNMEDTVTAEKLGFNKDKIVHIKGVGVEMDNRTLTDEEKDKLRTSLGLTKENAVITYVAEMNDNKNQMFLLRNWKAIKEKAPHAALLFAGIGPNLEQYKAYVEENNLKDIQFLGFRTDVPDLLQITDILSLLSQREGLPKSTMEGMAAGLPCVVSNTRGLVDLVQDNVNGYVVEKGNDANLIESYTTLLNDKALREQFGNAGKEKVKSFSLEEVIKDYAKIYGV